MSKERLEEVQLEKAKKILGHLRGYDVYEGKDDDEVLEFLIERVQRLEEDCEYLSHHYGLEAEKNKRYRESIERIEQLLTEDSFENAEECIQIARTELRRVRND